jgi:hypothetical protein
MNCNDRNEQAEALFRLYVGSIDEVKHDAAVDLDLGLPGSHVLAYQARPEIDPIGN